MALETIKNINVDFYDNRYILVNAKQYDDNSRYISVTCYSQGSIFNLNTSKHTAYIRYKKADEHTVFNFCTIDSKGRVLIELTEQMLASSGICDVDLVIINKGSAIVNIDTGEIVTIDNSAIISTMVFRINVYESAVDNSLIESSDEYSGLTKLLENVTAEYSRVINASEHHALMSQSWAIGNTDVEGRKDIEDTDNAKYYSQLSKSYAIGDANDIRLNEDADNAKYYSKQSSNSADSAKSYMDNAKSHMDTTKGYMDSANGYMSTTKSYMDTTDWYMDKAEEYMNTANTYMSTTKSYMDTTDGYMDKAEEYMNTANGYMNNAKTSETNANTYMNNAKTSETNANTYMNNAKTSEQKAEEYKNTAYEYCGMVKDVVDGLNSGFIPMGTISFSGLATAEKATGFTYNISDDFVTDNTFKEGAGKSYTAGTNVYYTADNYWDCFGGSVSPTATVDEVKEYLGI